MSTRVVKPGEPSIERVEQKLPVLPRSEAHRIRRTSRGYFDILLPEAMRVIADALTSEDMDDRKWAAEKVLRATLASTPNESSDPETVTVDGTSKPVDALKDLEKLTENGAGLADDS